MPKAYTNKKIWIRYILFGCLLLGGIVPALYELIYNVDRIEGLQRDELIKNHQIEVASLNKMLDGIDNVLKILPEASKIRTFYQDNDNKKNQGTAHGKIDISEMKEIQNYLNDFFYKYLDTVQDKYPNVILGIDFFDHKFKRNVFSVGQSYLQNYYAELEKTYVTSNLKYLVIVIPYSYQGQEVGHFSVIVDLKMIALIYLKDQVRYRMVVTVEGKKQVLKLDSGTLSETDENGDAICKTKEDESNYWNCIDNRDLPIVFVKKISLYGQGRSMKRVFFNVTLLILIIIISITWIEISLVRSAKAQEIFQQQLYISGKLTSIGTLAAGVAHELNNPLTMVIGFCKILKHTVKDEASVEYLEKIFYAAQRMANIVQRMRNFTGRMKEEKKSAFKITVALNNSLILLEKRLNDENVTLVQNHQEEVEHSVIYGDATRIEDVFQNLVMNSIDEFSTKRNKALGIEENQIIIKTSIKNKHIVIDYEDNAGGITDEVKHRMFDPFFTTKEVGKGVGLGMALSYETCLKHGGSLVIDNSRVGYARFILTFPVYSEKTIASKT